MTDKTMFLHILYAISFLAIGFGLYGGVTRKNRVWLLLPLGGLLSAYCTFFWLRPALDEAWQKIDAENIRIQLRSATASLNQQIETNNEQSTTLQTLRLQLEAQQLAQAQYGSTVRELIIQIRDLGESLILKGMKAESKRKDLPATSLTPTELLKYAKTEILTLYDLRLDQTSMFKLLRKAKSLAAHLSQQFPDHTPTISLQDQTADNASDPAVALDKQLTDLLQIQGNKKFLNEVYSELQLTLHELRNNERFLSVPESNSTLKSFLATDAERADFVLQTITSLKTISISPEFANKLLAQLNPIYQTVKRTSAPTTRNENVMHNLEDSISTLQEYNRLLTANDKVLCGVERSIGTPAADDIQPTPDVSSHEPYQQHPETETAELKIDRLILLNEAGGAGLAFREGSYQIDDPFKDVVRPLQEFRARIRPSLDKLVEIKVRGYADQKHSENKLYRTELLPEFLRLELADRAPLGYVRNDHLPHLRAIWIARLIAQIFPEIKVSVSEGELKPGTDPSHRTADIHLHWKR